jgi:hypothetical protein
MRTLAIWDSLRVTLSRIRDENPAALAGCPDLLVDRADRLPFPIELAPWATDVAAELDGSFGAAVELRVGFLQFPQLPQRALAAGPGPEPAADTGVTEVRVALEADLVLRSGHSGRVGLLRHNLGSAQIQLVTNVSLTAVLVDPITREAVGGFSSAQVLPMVTFSAAPGGAVRVPLLVGTASLVPDLGYAIPPGQWAMRTTLQLVSGRRLRTPTLPLTVTA